MVRAVLEGAEKAGNETELILLRKLKIDFCGGCGLCPPKRRCHVRDDMQEIYPKLFAADAIVLGTPCYDAPGCEGANYRSLIIVRSDSGFEDPAAVMVNRVAVNGKDSYSGWRVLGKTVASLGLEPEPFSEIIISGGHANSIDMVREGAADLAAIDGVTYALTGDVEPERLVGLSVLHQCPPAPGLPYVTRASMPEPDARRMTDAIDDAFADTDLADARRTLRLAGFAMVPLTEYERHMK